MKHAIAELKAYWHGVNPFRGTWEGWTWKDEIRHQARRVKFVFARYNLWVGFFYDSKERRLYFFPIPMFGLSFEFRSC